MASDYHVREVFFWLSGCENGIWLSYEGTFFPFVRVKKWRLIIM